LPALLLFVAEAYAQWGGTLRFAIRSEPKTLHPLLVGEESSEAVRYLTAGVLLRINRITQQYEPHLATKWRVTDGGRSIRFELRNNVQFSDGTPFTAEDVVYTIRLVAEPDMRSPTTDSFRSAPGEIVATAISSHSVVIRFPAPVAGIERLFDQLAILSARSPNKELAVLGPFRLGERKPGQYIRLVRNPNYWKTATNGRRLPYLDEVRLEIQQNRELELLRFRRGELHFINKLDAELYERPAADQPRAVRNAGPSLETEQVWFNQVASAPIAAHKKSWFRSQAFRNAISHAINRQDLVRIVFQTLASPGIGPISPANQTWFNSELKPREHDPKAALALLGREGFRMQNGRLSDRAGNPVEFSLITNSGNKARARMAALLQQDLKGIGIDLRVTTLDFPSLIERISRTYEYDACLLGLINVDLDPNGQMNVWLSSSSNHQWNPNQKSPETTWEAELDKLMSAQAATVEHKKRKALFDRVQRIVWEQEPFLYLVYKNSLAAVSESLRGVAVSMLHPQTFWNVDQIRLESAVARSHP
jgi:peptide/nickel transport system substrate-binding protein